MAEHRENDRKAISEMRGRYIRVGAKRDSSFRTTRNVVFYITRYLTHVHFVLNINLLDFPCPDIALFLIKTCAYKYKLLARR